MKGTYLYPILTLAFVLFFIQQGCTDDNRILAKAGDNIITVKEFTDRYVRFLKLSGIRDNVKIRSEYLNMMIDEKILLEYADTSGWIKRPDIQRSLRFLKDQICINHYFQRYILPDLKITEEDLREAYCRSKVKIRARHIYAPDLQTAMEIKKRLREGESFEKLAFEYFRDPRLAYSGGDLGWFSFGDMEPSFEDAVYKLKVGEISEPVRTVYGYSIIQVLEKRKNPFLVEDEFLMLRKRLERELRRQRALELMMSKTDEIASLLRIELNDEPVREVFQKLKDIKIKIGRGVLSPEDLPALSDTLWVAKNENEVWNTRILIEKLSTLQQRQWQRIRTVEDFKKVIAGLMIRGEIEKRIRELEIEDSKEVREKFEKYRRNRILTKIVSEIMDTASISEREILLYYNEHRCEFRLPELYSISELFVRDSVLAEWIQKELKKGQEFGRLAKRYSYLKRSKDKSGKLGWISRQEAGMVARFLKPENRGKVIGPVKIKAGYLFIKIDDYKLSRGMTFDEARSEIINILRKKAERRGYRNFLKKLRDRAGVFIDKKLLGNLSFELG